MSREVRRVPLGWKHPTEHNPHWLIQSMPMPDHTPVPSRLHGPTKRFIGLFNDYPGSVQRWERDLADLKARRGFDWEFGREYHLTGYKGHADAEATVHPWYPSGGDDPNDEGFMVRDETHLEELLLAKHETQRPDPADYMPVTTGMSEDQLGWCLYSTLTEGTPKTPVFATAEALVAHLRSVGEDGEEVPYRREAAELLIKNGGGLGGSSIIIDGQVFDSARDADQIAAAMPGLDS